MKPVAAARRRLALGPARVALRPVGSGASEYVGSAYGGWTVPPLALGPDAVVYSAGVGEDITFDLALIERFGCTVHAFDPVPEAAAHVATAAAGEPRFAFAPVGLWTHDTTLTFHENPNAGHVSRSATDMHGTAAALQAPVRSVASLMAEHGHERVDLLKLSVEGAEHALVADLVTRGLPVQTLLVEFSLPTSLRRVRAAVASLAAAGWELRVTDLRPSAWRTGFVKS